MWPFTRRETADTPAPPPVHRAGPGDWRHLAPIATVQTAPLTTIDGGFESHLATRRSMQFLRPLGHHLVPDGPSGRVAAAVVPGTRREFAPVATQRQVASPAPAAPVTDVAPATDDPTDPSDGVTTGPIEAPTVGATTATATAISSPASTPVVARSVERPSLVRAPEPSLPSTTVPTVPTVSRLADVDDPPPPAAPSDVLGPADDHDVAAPRPAEPVVPSADVAAEPPEVGLVGGDPGASPVGAPADAPEPGSISYAAARPAPGAAAPTVGGTVDRPGSAAPVPAAPRSSGRRSPASRRPRRR